jgi:DNA-binding LytR/AlgR family response regulator
MTPVPHFSTATRRDFPPAYTDEQILFILFLSVPHRLPPVNQESLVDPYLKTTQAFPAVHKNGSRTAQSVSDKMPKVSSEKVITIPNVQIKWVYFPSSNDRKCVLLRLQKIRFFSTEGSISRIHFSSGSRIASKPKRRRIVSTARSRF